MQLLNNNTVHDLIALIYSKTVCKFSKTSHFCRELSHMQLYHISIIQKCCSSKRVLRKLFERTILEVFFLISVLCHVIYLNCYQLMLIAAFCVMVNGEGSVFFVIMII